MGVLKMGGSGYDPISCQGMIYLLGRVTTCEDDKIMKLVNRNRIVFKPRYLNGLVLSLSRTIRFTRPSRSHDGVFMYREGNMRPTKFVLEDGELVEKEVQIPYSQYLQSSHWEVKRQDILIRDDHTCDRCGSYTELQVHHLNYDNLWHEKDEDLITLCKDCHAEEHGKGEHGRL